MSSTTPTSPGNATPTPDFDPLAKPYRYLEYLTFGPFLHRTRTHYLPQLTHASQALVLGDGDGRFTAALLMANPRVKVHAVDISPRMLTVLTRRAHPNHGRLTTEQADLRLWQPDSNAHYDLVTTHFLLDCLTTQQVSELARRLAPSLTPNAQWLISDFAIPPTPFGSLIAKPLISALYQCFRLMTHLGIRHLPDHSQALQSAHWTLHHHHPHLNGLLISQLWQQSSPTR